MDKVQPFEFGGAAANQGLIDPFGRAISYLRVSMTDRCDFRCVYCMSENMSFLPKAEILTLEELDRVCSAFVARGVRKLRRTGGEPLVRRGILTLVNSLSRHLHSGELDELTLTTNGSQLEKYSRDLVAAGIHRINVSLDTLDAQNSAPLRAGVRSSACSPGSMRRKPRALKSGSTWLRSKTLMTTSFRA